MSDKFSYFDFLMYLLPGSVFFLELMGISYLLWPEVIKNLEIIGENGLLSSILFIIVSFVLGNSIQIIANDTSQNFVKLIFWGGYWPSQLALIASSNIFKEKELNRIIEKLVSLKSIKDKEPESLKKEFERNKIFLIKPKSQTTKEELQTAMDISQNSFEFIRYSILGTEAGNKTQASEAQYQFCRGMFTVFGIGSIFLIIIAIFNNSEQIVIASMISLILLCLLFFWRTRGVGRGWVITVFRSVFSIQDKEEKDPKEQCPTSNYSALLIGCRYRKPGIR